MDEADLRILWLTENYFPQKGGMAESCDRIVSGLRKKGHSVDVAAVCRRAQTLEVEKRLGGTDIRTPAHEPPPHALNRLWNCVERLHREQPYECVVAFGGTTPMIAGPIYSRWLSAPLISCIRGNDFDMAVFSPNKRWILESCLNSSKLICAISRDKVERVKSLFPRHRVEYVPNGIDCTRWEALPSDVERATELRRSIANEKPYLIGLFGHLKSKKGVPFLLDVLRSMPEPEKIHLLLVGEMEDGLLSGPFPFGTTYVPFQDRYDLIPYYLACDCVVIPSIYDGLPNVLLEAASLGTICVASAVGGAADVLETHNDLLFAPEDAADCRDTLLRALGTPEPQAKKRAVGLMNFIRTRFTSELEIQEYSALLASCCRKSVPPLHRELLQ